MPSLACPVNGCEYQATNDDAACAAALLTAHTINHRTGVNPPATNRAQPEKLTRPQIALSSSSEDWAYFIEKWTEYKVATGITGRDLTAQLTDCCENQLKRDLFCYAGSTSNKSESDILAAIKRLAVKKENLTISRMNLLLSKQDRDEPVCAFYARLKGLASMCNYVVKGKCAHNSDVTLNYSDSMIRDVLITGLADDDIKRDVLSHTEQDMSLTELVAFVEAKEAGKISSARLSGTYTANAIRSSYKRQSINTNKPPVKPFKDYQLPDYNKSATSQRSTDIRNQSSSNNCGWCGFTGHGDGKDKLTRSELCPANKKTCGKCGIEGHFARCCRADRKNSLFQRRINPTHHSAAIAAGTNKISIDSDVNDDTVLTSYATSQH